MCPPSMIQTQMGGRNKLCMYVRGSVIDISERFSWREDSCELASFSGVDQGL